MKSIKKANIQKNRCFFSSKNLGSPRLRKKGGREEKERECYIYATINKNLYFTIGYGL